MTIRNIIVMGLMAACLGSPAFAYEEIAVSEGGTLMGTVKLEGKGSKAERLQPCDVAGSILLRAHL